MSSHFIRGGQKDPCAKLHSATLLTTVKAGNNPEPGDGFTREQKQTVGCCRADTCNRRNSRHNGSPTWSGVYSPPSCWSVPHRDSTPIRSKVLGGGVVSMLNTCGLFLPLFPTGPSITATYNVYLEVGIGSPLEVIVKYTGGCEGEICKSHAVHERLRRIWYSMHKSTGRKHIQIGSQAYLGW